MATNGMDDVDLGATTRRGTWQDWRAGVAKTQQAHARKGLVTGLLCAIGLILAVHISATFFDELNSTENLAKTERARVWQTQICIPPKHLPPDALAICAEYRDWLSRSPAMNALRSSLHHHVDLWGAIWVTATGWLFTWDPFYIFQAKQVVNAVCTSFSTAVPILMIFGLVYIALLFRGPFADLRCWLGLRNQEIYPATGGRGWEQHKQPTQTPYAMPNNNTKNPYGYSMHNMKYTHPGAPVEITKRRSTSHNRGETSDAGWIGLSSNERERLVGRVMHNMAAMNQTTPIPHETAEFGDVGV
jgi:hypothetical protein